MLLPEQQHAPSAPLDEELATLREGAARSGAPPLITLTPSQARLRVSAGDHLCAAGPAVTTRDLVPNDGTGESGATDAVPVPLRLYEPEHPRGTIVYAHGGGWATGDLAYSDELCRHLAVDAALRVVSVDYRLAPEHPFPAGPDDVAAAWRWSRRHFPGWTALGGDSAGGNLAAAVCLALVAEGSPPSATLLVYPVLDAPGATPSYAVHDRAFPIGADDMAWFWDHYTGGGDPHDVVPALAPLRAVRLDGWPDTHVVLAGHDPLHDEGALFAARLQESGTAVTVTDHPRLCHGFLRLTGASSAARGARAGLVEAVNELRLRSSAPRSQGNPCL